jgi:hypothetical protein
MLLQQKCAHFYRLCSGVARMGVCVEHAPSASHRVCVSRAQDQNAIRFCRIQGGDQRANGSSIGLRTFVQAREQGKMCVHGVNLAWFQCTRSNPLQTISLGVAVLLVQPSIVYTQAQHRCKQCPTQETQHCMICYSSACLVSYPQWLTESLHPGL